MILVGEMASDGQTRDESVLGTGHYLSPGGVWGSGVIKLIIIFSGSPPLKTVIFPEPPLFSEIFSRPPPLEQLVSAPTLIISSTARMA